MNKPTISIIANLYKSEKFIPKLIKSVLRQSYSNWELICVNDCSPGNDAEIISKFINHPKSKGRIRLINNEINLGISKAKKVGIENAKGEYITFIDGDDWFAPYALEKLIKPAIEFNVDLVIMNNIKIIPFLNITRKQRSIADYNRPIYNPELFDKYFISFFGVNLLNNYGYWGKLYKKDLILNINFTPPESNIYEDILFLISIFENINSLYFLDYYGYYWRWGGITSGKKNVEFNRIKVINRLNDISIIRKNLIIKYNYWKAYKYLITETSNIIIANISPLAKYSSNDIKSIPIKEMINTILKHDVYTFFKDCDKFNTNKDLLTNAIINYDTNKIYEICHNYYKSNRLRYFIRAILTKLNHLYSRV